MEPAVVIVDYGMGNLRSVENALRALDGKVEVASGPEALATATHVVLPGVGAFGDGMAGLRRAGWVDALTDAVVTEGRPLLGICLGMQLLARRGTEHGLHDGLGWIEGTVERLPDDRGVRVPHIGWNDVEATAGCELFEGLEHEAFYFVHSYALGTDTPGTVAVTEHGSRFAAAVQWRHVFGVQFHPEKSHRAGLALLRNFLAVSPC